MKMKNITSIILLVFVLTSCATNKLMKQSKQFMPNDIFSMGLYFGLSEDEFLKKDFLVTEEHKESFRHVYSLSTGKDEPNSVVCYFDSDDSNSLYEIIVIYN